MAELLSRPHLLSSVESVVASANDKLAAIERLGQFFSSSGAFGCTNASQGIVVVMSCLELRMGVVEFSKTYEVINGKIRKKAVAAHAEFESIGGQVEWLSLGSKSEPAKARFTFKDKKPLETSFGLKEAQEAGLVKTGSGWEKWISAMCCARVLSSGIIRLAPQIYAGFDDESESSISAMSPELVLPVNPLGQSKPPFVNTPTVTGTKAVEPTPAKTEPTPPAQPKPASEPALQIVKSDEKEEAAAGLAPETKQDSDIPMCDEEAFRKLLSLVNGKEKECHRFLMQYPTPETAWIKPGQPMSSIKQANLNRILLKHDIFKDLLEKFIAKGAQ